jgi:hypothetical protein
MATNRIDFISSYCDRWCERCAFTDRCSAFACDIAIGMCGDAAAGIELAVGVPAPVGGERPETAGERFLADYVEPSAQEMAEIERGESARRGRVETAPLARMSMRFGRQAHAWLEKHSHSIEATGDPVLHEAFAIAGWDSYLIAVKLRRAVDGRDRAISHEDDDDADPLQSDWNGSAKVALISLERSKAAWATIAAATSDSGAQILSDAVAHLHRTALEEFPNAPLFVRPGFDEPGSSVMSPTA